ncbi:MAG: transglycosylase SLT domain-containing protein, partial [Arenicellales bacterium]|nr:transglycosylase SLT domain-containing protein [Arenicellales bacterium]
LLPGITEPRWNIAAAIAYDRYLYDRWSKYISRSQRLSFTLASYNTGFSRTMDARNQAKASGRDPGRWQQVEQYVPLQTKNYVKKIFGLMDESS